MNQDDFKDYPIKQATLSMMIDPDMLLFKNDISEGEVYSCRDILERLKIVIVIANHYMAHAYGPWEEKFWDDIIIMCDDAATSISNEFKPSVQEP